MIGRALGVDAVADDVVVDHSLVERGGEHLVGAEADHVLELLLVSAAGNLDHANADAAVAEPEPDAAARQAVGREELRQRLPERGRVANLAAADDAAAQAVRATRTSSRSPSLTTCAALRLGRVDLQPDELLGHRAAPLDGFALARFAAVAQAATGSGRRA